MANKSRDSRTNPRALGTNPRALGTNPRAQAEPERKARTVEEIYAAFTGQTDQAELVQWWDWLARKMTEAKDQHLRARYDGIYNCPAKEIAAEFCFELAINGKDRALAYARKHRRLVANDQNDAGRLDDLPH
jgi:hypothetical protein